VAWSTRQLADLAGVTLRSIRHWHDIGLLPEPDRRSNGYKEYRARDLVLALRIARLTSLGFSLDEVAGMLHSGGHDTESLRGLRAELDTRIAALERVRTDVDELIDLGISPDLSPEAMRAMEVLGHDPASRNIAIVLAHLTPKADTLAMVEVMRQAPDEFWSINASLLELPADAPEEEIAAFATRAADALGTFFDAHPHVRAGAVDERRERADAEVLTTVATDGMNRAQRRAMHLILMALDSRR
jgi:DNA-binding transcriptional MerR regulator